MLNAIGFYIISSLLLMRSKNRPTVKKKIVQLEYLYFAFSQRQNLCAHIHIDNIINMEL